MSEPTGRAWVFGDDVDTDRLAPGLYMKGPLEAMAAHCLESLDPAFAAEVRPGDVVVAGRNFGCGSSREQAAEVLCHLGLAGVVAQSFAGIFYRNALNLGLLALVSAAAPNIRPGQRLGLDGEAAAIVLEGGEVLDCEPIPPHLLAMVRDGGLVPSLAKRLAGGKRA